MSQNKSTELARTEPLKTSGGILPLDMVLAADKEARKQMLLLKDSWAEAMIWGPEFEAEARLRMDLLLNLESLCATALGQMIYAIQQKIPNGKFKGWMKLNYPDLSPGRYNWWLHCFRMNEKGLPFQKKKPVTVRDMLAMDDPEYQQRLLEAGPVRSPSEYEADGQKKDKWIKALEDKVDKFREQIATGNEQLEMAKAGAAIPKHVKDEAQRIEFIRNQFWSFVKFWMSNLPDNANRLKLHKALFTELTDEMMELWADHIFPQAETRITKANRKGK